MNQNDMDRYFWRTGQQWSVEGRPIKIDRVKRIVHRTIFVLCVGFGVIVGLRLLLR